MRGELRESHQNDEKFLEFERTAIEQKVFRHLPMSVLCMFVPRTTCDLETLAPQFELKALRTENRRLLDVYNNLVHQRTVTAYIDLDETRDFEPSTTGTTTTLATETETPMWPSSPCHCRPIPRITRFARASQASNAYTLSSTPSAAPPAVHPAAATSASNLDAKFQEVAVLSQQIEELRGHLLRVKRSASFSRSSNRGGSFSRSASAPTLRRHPVIEEDIDEELSSMAFRTDQAVVASIKTADEHDTKQDAVSNKSSKKRARKRGKGFWRLFGICSSPKNYIDD